MLAHEFAHQLYLDLTDEDRRDYQFSTNWILLDTGIEISEQMYQSSALIVSANGQILKTRNFGDLQAGKQQVRFDVAEFPSGTYQIILMSDKGKLGTQKIVVTH